MLPGIATVLATAFVCLLAPKRSGIAPWVCAVGCSIASGFAITAAVRVLAGGSEPEAVIPLSVPGGASVLGLDPLSAFFLLLTAFIVPPAAIFGAGYLSRHRPGGATRGSSFFFCILVASMMLVVAARNGVLFLVSWEIMTVSSWVLVVSDHQDEGVRSAGRRYLVASQLGGACLVAMFSVLGGLGVTLGFSEIAAAAPNLSVAGAGIVLVLALLGFGTKAGLFPLHVWLPLAHPAAPSHVSAVMSAIMIKLGFYGILRIQLLLGTTPAPFAVTLIVIGALTAIYGIASGMGQRDLKRALACSSIENMGIAAVGFGLAALAAKLGHAEIAALAASGALLHLLAHTVLKGLLFLGAGAVLSGAHTRDLEKLGGLLRRLPWTGSAFVAGAAGLSALPPFAGLAGEWLLLTACFRAGLSFPVDAAVLVILAGVALVVAGGLAVASFTRLFGIAFLGEPRSDSSSHAAEGGPSMVVPLVALGVAGLVLGICPQDVAALLERAIADVARAPNASLGGLPAVLASLASVARISALLLVAIGTIVLLRSLLPGMRRRRRPGTWGCGYSRPSSRLEYTASSFTGSLLRLFSSVVKPRTEEIRAEGVFPRIVRSRTSVPDRVEKGLYEPLFAWVARWLSALRKFQHGQLNKYVLQIVGAVVVGLLWAVGSRWLGYP